MRVMTLIIVGLAAMATDAPALAAEKPILSASTEVPTPGAIRPSSSIVRAVLKVLDKDEIEQLDNCIAESGFRRGDYAALLSAVRIRNSAGRTLWFVRPALEPFCSVLYGAHLFRYFFFEQLSPPPQLRYRLVFYNGGDAFSIYRRVNHGLNDIEPEGCIASGCRSARLSYNGREYRPVRCLRRTWDKKGREVVLRRRCGSDDGSDLQSSGFVKE